MLQEEIARLTGKLVFQVDNRPLATFEKKLSGVMSMLKEFQGIANKKFTVKVALDSRSLRSQIEKATKTKISLSNVDISQEALHTQSKRIQEYLNRTTINLNNVRIDISKLVEQKRFVKTLLGQMTIDVPAKIGLTQMEAELKRDLKTISERNPLKIKVDLNNNNLAIKLRRAMIEAQKRMGELKIRVANPQVQLKIDKQHLIEEIRAALASSEFKIRVGATRSSSDYNRRDGQRHSGRSPIDRGLSSAMGFARGALPGLGAAFAFSKMNDINQKVTAATNSLEAVSGSEANFKSNDNYLKNMTREMGLNYRDVAPQFSSIYQAASPKIGVKGTQDMFRGIMQYGTVHGLSKESMKGSMVALSQMFGKGKIQSEEARQQFSERMPNGMAMLAQAAFDTKQIKTNSVAAFGDLMQKGTADPNIILPQLAKNMKIASEANDAYKKSLDTTRVAQGRMNTEFESSVVLFAKGGFDKGMGHFFNTLGESMRDAAPLIEALGGAFEILIMPINSVIKLIGALGAAWPDIAATFGLTSKELATLAIGIGVFMLPFGGLIVSLGLAAIAFDDLVTYMRGGDSVFGDWVKNTKGAQDAIDSINQSMDGLKQAWADLKETFKDSGNPFKDWSIDSVLIDNLKYISTLINSLSATIRAFALIKEGRYADAAKSVGGGLADVVTNNPGVNLYKKIPEFYSGVVGDVAGAGKDWLQNYRSGHEGMPTPGTSMMPMQGQEAGQTQQTINLGGLTINAQTSDGTDPRAAAEKLAPHIQELTRSALRDALGAVRAQQAER
jgi:tape measure domain-containing protein